MGFIVVTNSYKYKDSLKEEGYKYDPNNRVWFKADCDFQASEVICQTLNWRFEGCEPCYIEKMEDLPEMLRYVKENQPAKKVESVYENKVIEVKAWYAQVFKNNYSSDMIFRNMKVLKVHADTQKAILVDVEYFGGVAACCGVCGRSLDNKVSIACGIGPICAEKIGLDRPTIENAKLILEQLKELSKKQGVFEKVWIPKSQIKSMI